MSRRKWLGSLLVGGGLAAAGGLVALARSGGYETGAAPPEAALRVLSRWQFVVVSAVARRVVAPDNPEGVPSPDDVGVASFIDGYLVEMRPALRRDFLRLLRYVEQLAPLGSGYLSRFTQLQPPEQDEVLAALEASWVNDLRAGFQALKSLIVMGYYRDPRTFALIGYGGPLVDDAASPAP